MLSMMRTRDARPSRDRSRLSRGIGAVEILVGLTVAALVTWLFFLLVWPRITAHRAPPPSEVPAKLSRLMKIQVLNGCGEGGVATQVAARLRWGGGDVVETGNAESFTFPQTLIVDRAGDRTHAQEVARLLGVPIDRVIEQRNDLLMVDCSVVIGLDFSQLALSIPSTPAK